MLFKFYEEIWSLYLWFCIGDRKISGLWISCLICVIKLLEYDKEYNLKIVKGDYNVKMIIFNLSK